MLLSNSLWKFSHMQQTHMMTQSPFGRGQYVQGVKSKYYNFPSSPIHTETILGTSTEGFVLLAWNGHLNGLQTDQYPNKWLSWVMDWQMTWKTEWRNK